MTTLENKIINPATKQKRVIARYRAIYSRPHGRPRNVGRRLKVRRLPNESH